MKKIIAYHGNLYFDAFVQHVDEIKAKGFNIILFCITETDLLYNLETFKEFREHAEAQGIETWATFWGLTAGEAICKDGDVEKWIYSIKSIGFNNVMIDEPKSLSDINHFLQFSDFLNFHLCLCDNTFNNLSDEQVTKLPVSSLGVSCYHWVTDWMKITLRTEATAMRLKKLRPNDNFLFIQGFDIPEGWELLPNVVKEVGETVGITNFGFWSFRATAATASKRPVNHKHIWNSIKF